MPASDVRRSLRDILFGRPLASHEEGEQRVGPVSGIPMLGLDALSSAAYGPEAAMTLLIPLGAAGLGYVGPISGVIIVLLLIVFLSYRQTITAYPAGGGSYTVARENLGTVPGTAGGRGAAARLRARGRGRHLGRCRRAGVRGAVAAAAHAGAVSGDSGAHRHRQPARRP